LYIQERRKSISGSAPTARAIDSIRSALYKRYHDMPAKKPKPRKVGRKDKGILIRVTKAQKQVLAETAREAGLGLSSWMLSVALRAAQKMKRA
jgi:hypothetical protein